MAEIGVISTLQEGVRALNRLANAVTPGPFSITNNAGDVVWSLGPYGQMFVDINISAPPSSLGNWDSILTAFSGDLSHLPFAISHQITGATTLGQPVTGYLYTPEAYASSTYVYNNSGWNQGTADNVGRTAAVAHYIKADQYGQGDLFAYAGSVFVNATRAGATHWLASPAGTLLGGQTLAGVDGVFLQGIGDVNLSDQGHDVAAAAFVSNMNRTNATGAISADWMGVRLQSTGSQQIGAFYSATGKGFIGLDFTKVTFDANAAAIVLPQGGRIYGNSTNANPFSLPRFTSLGVDWIERSSTNWRIVYNNVGCLLVNDSQVTVVPSVRFNGTNLGFYNTTPIVKQTVSGSRGGNVALANLLTALANLGLIIDSTTP